MKPQVGMILVHNNLYVWEVVGVGPGEDITLLDVLGPDLIVETHFDPDTDVLYPDKATALAIIRLLGSKPA